MTRRIFVSYRRDDCAAHAGWLASTLRSAGAGDVFLDVEDIAPGENFVRRIQREIEACDVVLVVIGREWLTLPGEDGAPRIHDELDWVHLEVRSALERDVPVVPVLVERARMPRPGDLPEPVRDLAYRNAVRLAEESWASDVARLVGRLPLARLPQVSPTPAPPAPGPAEPRPAPGSAEPPPARHRPHKGARDVVVVAARVAYPEYLAHPAYVCQARRTFQPTVRRLGFYCDRQIFPELPMVLHRRDHVLWTQAHAEQLRSRGEPFDMEVAAVIELNTDPGSPWFAMRRPDERYQAFVLSAPDDPQTLRMGAAVRHHGSGAWTQNQRYLDSGRLALSPATTDDL